MGDSDQGIEETVEQVKISCENDCEDGFDVYMTEQSLILICKGCQTEYEISGKGSFTPAPSEFQ